MSSRSSSNHPQFEHLHHVGYVQSAHGIRGEVYVRLFAGAAEWCAGRLSLLTSDQSRPAEREVRSARPHKDGLLVVFADVGDRDAAEALKGAQVYVADELLEAPPGERIYLKQIFGFAVVDVAGTALGEIVDFATNGAQDLLVLRRTADGRRALVPFVDAFLIGIDFERRLVKMDLPEGLLDLG